MNNPKEEAYYKSLENIEGLTDEVYQLYVKEVDEVIAFIKRQDEDKNPDADPEDEVVDINVLKIPILAGLIQAHYKGMLNEHEREKL